MNLPRIDLATIPDLETMTGVFGSSKHALQASSDDTLIIIMVYLYNLENK